MTNEDRITFIPIKEIKNRLKFVINLNNRIPAMNCSPVISIHNLTKRTVENYNFS
jgi:hypothetical protein